MVVWSNGGRCKHSPVTLLSMNSSCCSMLEIRTHQNHIRRRVPPGASYLHSSMHYLYRHNRSQIPRKIERRSQRETGSEPFLHFFFLELNMNNKFICYVLFCFSRCVVSLNCGWPMVCVVYYVVCGMCLSSKTDCCRVVDVERWGEGDGSFGERNDRKTIYTFT